MATGVELSAIELLKSDHDIVKELFEKFENTEDKAAQKKIVQEAVEELNIHAAIEEQIFYPAVRTVVGEGSGIMQEANEEHHVAKVLIAELEEMTGSESHFVGKFKVLTENVRHHIEEEERDMFPKVEASDLDLNELGRKMFELKEKFQAEGVSPTAEASMVEGSQGQGDSPAHTAEQLKEAAEQPS